jgi:hypothetical protein
MGNRYARMSLSIISLEDGLDALNLEFKESLYIKLGVGQTIKGGIGKIYWVCYPIFEKKETSCKEIE